MGLIDKLPESVHGLKGSTPATRAGALKTSKIHNPDSFEPSKLDLNGVKPKQAGKLPYLDNLPK